MKQYVRSDVDYKYSVYERPPKDYVVIDFETATKAPDSVCQIGIVTVKGNQIVREESYLIRPPYKKFVFSDIHGITYEDVKDAPTFDEIWEKIKNEINGRTIAAYNLIFDWRCLMSTLNYYGIGRPSCEAFDVLANVKSLDTIAFEDYKLVTVAKKLGLSHKAHDALSDARVTAEIEIYISKNFPGMSVKINIASLAAIIERIRKKRMTAEEIISYGNGLLNGEIPIDYEEYKKLFMMLEQVAEIEQNAKIFKLCGLFFEKFAKIPRALNLYKKSLALDSGMKLKTRIQRLEKIMRDSD